MENAEEAQEPPVPLVTHVNNIWHFFPMLMCAFTISILTTQMDSMRTHLTFRATSSVASLKTRVFCTERAQTLRIFLMAIRKGLRQNFLSKENEDA